MKRLQLLVVAAFTVLLGFTACDQNRAGAYEDWDRDGDGLVSTEEFNAGFVNANPYKDWDADQDGVINEYEWNTGLSKFPKDSTNYGVFSDWDTDRDGYVNADEYHKWFHR